MIFFSVGKMAFRFSDCIFVFMFISWSATLVSSLCEDITGRWRNQLASEVIIYHLPTGEIHGRYYTTVSSKNTALPSHKIVGALPYNKPGSSFAFSVNWQSGSSTTVWTGQCLECNGEELLETSWLLRSNVDSCIDLWKSTQIGKDVFKRISHKFEVRINNDITPLAKPAMHACDLNGVWYNDLGSEVILNQTSNGGIVGEYRTAVEREKGAAGTSHSLVYGLSAYGNPKTTFSLMVVWRNGASVTGWIGQCHICNNTVVLEMGWLLRSKETCANLWKSTLYGTNTFTRHEQKDGPRKSKGVQTPNGNGEDLRALSCFTSSNVLLVLSFVVMNLCLQYQDIF
ncbi:uncharacterized protein LOC124442356 isoform X1 [Xenia sp. Carnegie-2017]|uniref:uncharacterized protein LOC124442356 isoform X1 n=1 Tax=Xenia sp. Carnegie-2017 TaxID=2897299 RepID=UPI001F050585|nr:uncharacterized protein LOC124442356 isoform X1 [Xenia sp. Carnegie-2017]